MVKGIDVFRDYFSEYTEQYVLIGGAACDISFGSNDVDFQATRDLDVVFRSSIGLINQKNRGIRR